MGWLGPGPMIWPDELCTQNYGLAHYELLLGPMNYARKDIFCRTASLRYCAMEHHCSIAGEGHRTIDSALWQRPARGTHTHTHTHIVLAAWRGGLTVRRTVCVCVCAHVCVTVCV